MRLTDYVIPFLVAGGIGCGRQEAGHVQAPENFDALVESRRVLALHLPDTLSCDQEMRVRTDGNGRLYVGLAPHYHIGVFDSVGGLLNVVGRQGFGPGEFMKILDFRVGRDGRVYVMNALTEDLSVYDSTLKWTYAVTTGIKQVMTFDVFQNRLTIFRRHIGAGESFHIVIATMVENDRIVHPITSFLDSGDESIRTHMLRSQTLSTSPDGTVLFAFMAAKVVHVISDDELSEIEIDESVYKVSQTRDLETKLKEMKVGGFMAEVFANSRILSLGFVSPQHILVSFATGRFAQTRFYAQLYCLSTKRAFSKAYELPYPLHYVGDFTFANWDTPNASEIEKNRVGPQITLYRFRSHH